MQSKQAGLDSLIQAFHGRQIVRTSLLLSFLMIFVGIGGCHSSHEADLSSVNEVRGENVIVFGDCRGGYSIFRDIVQLITMLEDPPAGIMMAGDLIADPGNEFQWSCFMDEISPWNGFAPYHAVVGNHDVDDYQSQKIMMDVFKMERSYYTQYLLNIYFIILDSEEPGFIGGIGTDQRNWLIQKLQNKPEGAAYTMIVLHRPLFPISSKEPLWKGIIIIHSSSCMRWMWSLPDMNISMLIRK
ncbi:metallophosphoesterase family protein [candidate division CSSED10-310 bacterium]|uniref:Metallophosphoesterase family protein n=1 Tax=candidate division CSSED10-310 bacterium TaxID=2855610 RepID=A0ABV6YWY4_UNCC1